MVEKITKVKRARLITLHLKPEQKHYSELLQIFYGGVVDTWSKPLRTKNDAAAIRKAFLPCYKRCADILKEFGFKALPKNLTLLNVNTMASFSVCEITFTDIGSQKQGIVQPYKIKLSRPAGTFAIESISNGLHDTTISIF